MKKQIASVIAAVLLGIATTTVPVIAFMLLEASNNTFGSTSFKEAERYEATSWQSINDAAQNLGETDIEPSALSTSLAQAAILAATSLIVALTVSITVGRKIALAVPLTETRTIKEQVAVEE